MKVFFTIVLIQLAIIVSGCGRKKIIQGKTEIVAKGVFFSSSFPGTGSQTTTEEAAFTEPRETTFKWDTPKGWEEKPSSGIRIASFGMPGGGECSIIVLSGSGGSLEANYNMWRTQVKLPNISKSEALKKFNKDKASLGEFSWTMIINKKISEGILVAVLPAGDKTLFVKVVSTEEILSKEKDNFLKLVKSIRYP